MAIGNYVTGKVGFFLANGLPLGFGSWKIAQKVEKIKVPTWLSPQFKYWLPGQFDATATVTGSWNIGAVPVALGSTYTFAFGAAVGVNILLTGFVSDINTSNDVEGQPLLNFDVQQNQAFSLGTY
jgi:hypothetical protein